MGVMVLDRYHGQSQAVRYSHGVVVGMGIAGHHCRFYFQ